MFLLRALRHKLSLTWHFGSDGTKHFLGKNNSRWYMDIIPKALAKANYISIKLALLDLLFVFQRENMLKLI